MRKKYDTKCFELEAVKRIYEACREAERETGAKIDFDGKIEIDALKQNGITLNDIDNDVRKRVEMELCKENNDRIH